MCDYISLPSEALTVMSERTVEELVNEWIRLDKVV